MVACTGACLVHRAEIMQFHGAWPEALAEAGRAYERSQQAPPKSPGAALYLQAEIHRLRGDYTKADEGYRDASRLGYEPQPGLALLRLAQGRTDAASAAIRRLLIATTDGQRARLLPAYLEIMLAAGEPRTPAAPARSFRRSRKRSTRMFCARHSGESAVAPALRNALGRFTAAQGRVTLPGWYRVVFARVGSVSRVR
jgi:tetratricopeptide (TPR) repeat protein